MKIYMQILASGFTAVLSIAESSIAQEIEFVSSTLWTDVRDMETAGDYLYAAYHNGLVIYDVSNPESPTESGRLFCGGSAQGLAINGGYAYLADSTFGLKIIDISNSGRPNLVGLYDTPGTCREVSVVGDYAYVVDGSYGLWIINTANKSNPTMVGGCDTPDQALDIAINGNYAYVADDYEGVQVINISNPQNPYIYINRLGTAERLALRGQLMFAITTDNRINVFDIASPHNPLVIDTLYSPAAFSDIAFAGNFMFASGFTYDLFVYEISGSRVDSVGAYDRNDLRIDNVAAFDGYLLCAAQDRLLTLDIDNPSMPRPFGHWENNGYAYDVAIDGNYAYVADYDQGLHILDISNLASPQPVGYYNALSNVYGVAKAGGYAYITTNSGLTILDITSPGSPQFVGSYGSGYDCWAVFLVGNYAYVPNSSYGLLIINVANPANPTLVGRYDTPGLAFEVVVAGGFAYVADGLAGLQIINVSNPANPVLAGNYQTASAALDLSISGGYAYLALEQELASINISDPSNPTMAGSVNLPGPAYGIALMGEIALVADAVSGLQVVDITDPADPILLGGWDTPGYAEAVFISGNYALIADGASGLQIARIYGPSLPILASELIGMENLLDVDVDGQYAYVIGDGNRFVGWGYLNIFDISNPRSPAFTGRYRYDGFQYADIDIQSDYAYIAAYGNGLEIVDVSDRSNPDPVGNYVESYSYAVLVDGIIGYMSGNFRILLFNLAVPQAPVPVATIPNWIADDFAKSGDLLYFATGGSVRSYNVSNPANPLFAALTVLPYATNIEIAGDRLYVAAGDSGFKVLDISDPDTMRLIGGLPLPDRSNNLAIMGNYAIVGTARNGMFIVDISDPANPVQVAQSNLARNIRAIDAEGNHIYVADNFSLMTFAFPATAVDDAAPAPSSFSLAQNYPNPFNAATNINYWLPSPASVTIDIFDILGRNVVAIDEGEKPAGNHLMTWNAAGRPSGVYFYRLRAGQHSETRKMILVK